MWPESGGLTILEDNVERGTTIGGNPSLNGTRPSARAYNERVHTDVHSRRASRKLRRNTYTRYVRINSKVLGRLRRARRTARLCGFHGNASHEKVRLD